MDEKYVLLNNLGCMSFILNNNNINYCVDSLRKKKKNPQGSFFEQIIKDFFF